MTAAGSVSPETEPAALYGLVHLDPASPIALLRQPAKRNFG